ncbi:MAG: type II toxin-antitoxin system RelE/ParE family toxin [Chloroflexota bacterium]|nr:MAG: type II toxin-antitoxin system RelE/ParE family toxin [Chloroflexota bacterium]
MLEVRWSSQTRADIRKIAEFWRDKDRTKVRAVIEAIRQRVAWLTDGHAELGSPMNDLPQSYRWYRERTFGYKIFYRTEGDPVTRIAIITIRHGRQRPLSPSTIRKRATP